MEYNKLVRDKIPEIIIENGSTPITHIATGEEIFEMLKLKLTEEMKEYLESNDPEELADILEVIYSLAQYQNITIQEIEKIRLEKKEKRGGFSQNIILEKTIDPKK
ncbi:nucleoside triphosphate pyrophosphohydrolase [Candidatus Gracilibacteria bacterium]|nr:nucleoside triphosphate pyrophosphohydrolase [Candidatus Gracilibacteria bacterium]